MYSRSIQSDLFLFLEGPVRFYNMTIIDTISMIPMLQIGVFVFIKMSYDDLIFK